ncbi:uncharacterized protein [Arachis hypogaea]|uniref:Zinc finger PHD-type domain-containing protein n=1 Tax=Arachis hypogaea TaxID=3818 RepID=A0A445CL55_ARAHY|nr:uncharacterized protein LOC112696124 [Arachis hypogaea]QHO44646.1 uncharacterized protein DS421_6g172520 [Arachis hypogaea]RYR51654.1 hypothetical protein Ahy_A06g026630 [Arachis hypogaea]
MGSIMRKDPSVVHFSHPHPLEFTTELNNNNNVTCFGCKLSFMNGESYYHCKPCNFSLHYACFKMPLITNHPSHSKHDLVLIVIPSSPATRATLRCAACGHHVTGFTYHCAECSSVFFHAFCLALPLSVAISPHPHRMELEFMPPYDFFCDLCTKSTYNIGWLYRCRMCEFDSHIACAVQNIEPQSVEHPSFTQANALMTQFTAHHGGGMVYEIMRLVATQIQQGKVIGSPSPSRGRDFRAYLEERTPLRDKSTPSRQFSEAYFSIDLNAKKDGDDQKSNKNNLSVVAERSEGDKSVKLNSAVFEELGEANHKVVMVTNQNSKQRLLLPTPKTNNKSSHSGRDRGSSGWKKFLSCCL